MDPRRGIDVEPLAAPQELQPGHRVGDEERGHAVVGVAAESRLIGERLEARPAQVVVAAAS